jgi:hypothetical protein
MMFALPNADYELEAEVVHALVVTFANERLEEYNSGSQATTRPAV